MMKIYIVFANDFPVGAFLDVADAKFRRDKLISANKDDRCIHHIKICELERSNNYKVEKIITKGE